VPGPPLSSRDLAELASPSTVSVRCGDMVLSGFFAAPETVLTRLPAGCGAIEVGLADGRRLRGEVRETVQWFGLSRIHTSGAGFEPLEIGDATTLHPGSAVVFLSMTGEGNPVLHETRIGTAAREIQQVAHLPLDGNVTLGDVGGPVLNTQGRVVGVVAGEADGEAFLLPINYAYEDSRLVERPRSGASPQKWRELLTQVRTAEAARVTREESSQRSEEPVSSSPPSPSMR
jgi:S1-C subfamily serine protease